MISSNTGRLNMITLLMAAGTWIVGWWAVPFLAVVAGLVLVPAWISGVGAGLAWALLLTVNLAGGQFGKLATMLAGVMGLPAAAIIAVTILFPMLLGWSAAAAGNALRSIRGNGETDGHMSRAP